MKINLIPKELRPSRASPVPYMPLAGLLGISMVWIVTQFAMVAGARTEARDYRREHRRLSVQLKEFKNLPGRSEHAESERDTLKLKAAAVTVLTHSGFACTEVIQALAEAASEDLRLTTVSIDYDRGAVVIKGYGSEETADLRAASFVKALNQSKTVLAMFYGAELNYCNSSRRGDRAVKEFGVSLPFRDQSVRTTVADDEKEDERG